MQNPQSIVQLIARLLFGLSVLALLFLASAQMADHHFQGAAERAIREAFTEGVQPKEGATYDTVCRRSDAGRTAASDCDPIAVMAQRSYRSASCSGGGLLRLLGKQWSCVARFTDGATVRVDVSLGLRHRHLEIFLPFRDGA